jgi:hypothetical protein
METNTVKRIENAPALVMLVIFVHSAVQAQLKSNAVINQMYTAQNQVMFHFTSVKNTMPMKKIHQTQRRHKNFVPLVTFARGMVEDINVSLDTLVQTLVSPTQPAMGHAKLATTVQLEVLRHIKYLAEM